MVSAALSRAPMMQVRPLRERANLMAARTLGSMEPLPNWPSSARRSQLMMQPPSSSKVVVLTMWVLPTRISWVPSSLVRLSFTVPSMVKTTL